MRRGAWKHGLVLGAVVLLLFACGGIDSNELHCEEAVSHLEDCCPGIDARRFQCEEEDACNQQSPDFYDKASECIRDRSCEELRAQGKCDALKAIANSPYPSNSRDRIEVEACK